MSERPEIDTVTGEDAQAATLLLKMHLLTWHGTLLAQTSNGVLVHTTLTPGSQRFTPLTLGLFEPVVHAPMDSGGMPDMKLLPGPSSGTVHFLQGKKYLQVIPDIEELAFRRDIARGWETFLLIDLAKIEALQLLLSHAWLDGGVRVARSAICLGRGFNLDIGRRRINLVKANLSIQPESDNLLVSTPNMNMVMRRDRIEPEAMMMLRTVGERAKVADVTTEAAFKAGSNRRWRLPPQTDLISSPLFISDEDWHWTHERFWQSGDPPAGRLNASCRLGRARDVGVVLTRFGEGTLFDEHGVINEDGYLHNLQTPLPMGLTSENGSLSLDADVFRNAPVLRGSYIVFIKGNLQNYYHWLLDSLVALDILNEYAPTDAKLLIPGTVSQFKARPINRFDHLAVLHAVGPYDRQIEVAPEHVDFARLEEAIWLDDHYVESLPGSHLRAIRDRLLVGRDQRRPRLRICIQRARLRGLANPEKVEGFLARNGFSFYELEDMPPETQIALFQDAEFVVAPHGAGLANLLFCLPKTKVLELSPDKEFRPFFWLMSNKLGLSHGVLPSPTHDGSFNGMMNVDLDGLQRMFQMLTAR